MFFFFFFKQKTAYEIVPCDWSSDVCSSDLKQGLTDPQIAAQLTREGFHTARRGAVTVATIHKLRSRDTQVSASALHQHRKVAMVNGYWTIPGLTRELGVGDNWLYSRIRQGRFSEGDIHQLPNYH